MMRYSTQQIAYHWITFALILVMAGTGLTYSYELADSGAIRVHQIAGQILMVVLILRLAMRLQRGTPPPQESHATWERRLAHIVHIGLYVVLFAFVATGYVAASGETDNALIAPLSLRFARSDFGETLLVTHYALKWALLALFVLHIGGAVKHAVLDRDGTLSRMMFSKR